MEASERRLRENEESLKNSESINQENKINRYNQGRQRNREGGDSLFITAENFPNLKNTS